MKVRFQDDYKRFFTIEDVRASKIVIKFMKEEESFTTKDYCDLMVNNFIKFCDSECVLEYIKVDAYVGKNPDLWEYDLYGEGSAFMDVCLYAMVRTNKRIFEIYGKLSDIWQLSSDNAKEIANKCEVFSYIKNF